MPKAVDHAATLEALFPSHHSKVKLDVTDQLSVVKTCSRLVMKIARKMPRPIGWEVDDLVQVGLLAVLQALPGYKPELSAFSSWAYRTAKSAMWRTVFYQAGPVCVHPSTQRRQGDEAHFRVKAGINDELDDLGSPAGWGASGIEASAELMLAEKHADQKKLAMFAWHTTGLDGNEIGERLGVTRGRVHQVLTNGYPAKLERYKPTRWTGDRIPMYKQIAAEAWRRRAAGEDIKAIAKSLNVDTRTVDRALDYASDVAKNAAHADAVDSAR